LRASEEGIRPKKKREKGLGRGFQKGKSWVKAPGTSRGALDVQRERREQETSKEALNIRKKGQEAQEHSKDSTKSERGAGRGSTAIETVWYDRGP